MKVKNRISVHAYKYNGWLYRTYEFPKIIDINNNFICLQMYNTKIISQNIKKRNFHSEMKMSSFWFFFPDEWFNLIVTKNNSKILYYINIATPFVFEEETIKYYDLDLDLQMPNINLERINILDVNEFNENKIKFNYPKNLEEKAKQVQKKLIKKLQNKELQKIFNKELIDKYLSTQTKK